MKSKEKEVQQKWDDYYDEWASWRDEAVKDYQMALGDQWAMVPVTKAMKDIPRLNINSIKKPIALLSGYQRQNRTDLTVFPIEGSDEEICDIHSRLIKWTLGARNYQQNVSLAFTDALICGIGWLHLYIDFSEDIYSGDIRIIQENPFKIMPDPYANLLDLNNCTDILRRAYITKNETKLRYANTDETFKLAAEIDKLSDTRELPSAFSDSGYRKIKNKINVVERWYWDNVEKKFLVDLNTGDVKEFTGDERNAIAKFSALGITNIAIQKRSIQIMKLQTVANGELTLYNRLNPYGIDSYCFVPILGSYTPNYPDWKLRLQGVVRGLRDPQIEKNKTRSAIMEVVLSQPRGKMSQLRGTNVEVEKLRGGPDLVKVDDHDDIRPLVIPEVSSSMLQLFQIQEQDLRDISPNPDLLGNTQGSGVNAPGITLQLRQRQGLISTQDLYDNLSVALKQAGIIHVKLVNLKYKRMKIERILGDDSPGVKNMKMLADQFGQLRQANPQSDEELTVMEQQVEALNKQIDALQGEIEKFWKKFEKAREGATYDCKVDEIQNTPTYRILIGSQLQDLKKQGQEVPFEVIMEYLELPPAVKETWKQKLQEQQEMMMAMEKQKQDFQMALEKMKLDANMQQAVINKMPEPKQTEKKQ